jgi:hypothetical protein
MHLAAGGAPVAVKHRAMELVNKVKILPVVCNAVIYKKACSPLRLNINF